ncbi:mCG147070 [Mus musculus]|nr:mCG147070 [Mus musculus]
MHTSFNKDQSFANTIEEEVLQSASTAFCVYHEQVFPFLENMLNITTFASFKNVYTKCI